MQHSSNMATNQTIKSSLVQLEEILSTVGGANFYESLAEELHHFHVLVRTHHAADMLAGPQPESLSMPPQCGQDLVRLRNEHTEILGKLDRLVCVVDSMPDQADEDQEVFFFRVRELIAVMRRHEAEEDRIYALALWHDTGGES